jgi:hypothetical protein
VVEEKTLQLVGLVFGTLLEPSEHVQQTRRNRGGANELLSFGAAARAPFDDAKSRKIRRVLSISDAIGGDGAARLTGRVHRAKCPVGG